MALTYTYSTKLIGVPQADAQPLLMQTLINSIRAQEASEQGITYDKIADAGGKEDLGGGVVTGITVSLLSTWKLNFATGAYQATVSGGNLADGLNRINNTGSPQVLLNSSAAATIVATGSGVTAQDKIDIAAETLTQMNAFPPNVNIKQVNDVDIQGAGVEGGDYWRPA